jgi:Ser-tRNA(Ala) deacylase AlaX
MVPTTPCLYPLKLTRQPPTNALLYQTDQSIRQFDTNIKQSTSLADLDEADRSLFAKVGDATHVLATERTIFHPQGGGQPSDTGTMTLEAGHFNVSLARPAASASTILHAGHFTPESAHEHFGAGKSVHQEIDSAARDLHSRIHTAGHLIGFAVHALREQIGAVGEGKASHYPGAASVEFIGRIDGEHKAAIEAKANQYMEQNLPVRILFLDEDETKRQCTAVPDVIKSGDEGWVRVMAVNGLGAYPCGEFEKWRRDKCLPM